MLSQNPVFIPGPTNIPEAIRQAMDIPTHDHRSPAFAERLGPLRADLQRVFKTADGEVLPFPGSGTGGREAAISNTLSPGDRVLAARHGTVSERWIDRCRRLGLEVDVIDRARGDGAPSERFADRLAADREHVIKALLVTHNETATGVCRDAAAPARCRESAA